MTCAVIPLSKCRLILGHSPPSSARVVKAVSTSGSGSLVWSSRARATHPGVIFVDCPLQAERDALKESLDAVQTVPANQPCEPPRDKLVVFVLSVRNLRTRRALTPMDVYLSTAMLNPEPTHGIGLFIQVLGFGDTEIILTVAKERI